MCRPEFLNRLDEIIVFRQLTKQEVKQIADIMLAEVFSRAETKGIKIDVTERFKVLALHVLLCMCLLVHALWQDELCTRCMCCLTRPKRAGWPCAEPRTA